MCAKQHHQAADHFDGVADEHDLAFGPRVGKGPDKRCEDHIKQCKHGHQSCALPFGTTTDADEFNGCNKERIVGQRAEKLGRHDGVKTALHVFMQ